VDEIESQIAKIQLGNNKTSTSYVYIMAEKAGQSSSELYVVAELPLFNPAAEESCERICLAIASGLKRAYKRPGGESAFENAISQINEELGKLASLGQTQWINKLSCILGVKEGNNFNIATCGKVSAYLLRGGEYTDISCSPAQSHPLKTFENYASGKVRLGDLLILSTTQMFNFLSMDRLLNIVSTSNFLTASQTILELLKGTSEPQVSFGVLLNLQAPAGEIGEEELDLENYIVEASGPSTGFAQKILNYAKDAFALGKNSVKRQPQTGLPQVSFSERLQNINSNGKNLLSKTRGWWQNAKTGAKKVTQTANVENFRGMSRQKKFLLASIFILLVAFISNLVIANHLSKTHATQTNILNNLHDAQTLLGNVQSSLLYKDDVAAAKYFQQAKAKMPNAKDVPSADKDLYSKLLAQITDTQNLMDKTVQAAVSNLGSLGKGDELIKLPGYLGVQVNNAIISFNKQNGKVEDSALKAGATIVNNVFLSGNTAAIYDGGNLYVWDFSAGALSPGFSQGVPAKNNMGGLAQYPTNGRVYIVDKKLAQIVSFAPSSKGLSRPVVSVRDPQLSQAQDLAIDSSIYVLTTSGIAKFQSGYPVAFNLSLATPFSGSGKIYTQKDFTYIYVLDTGNNRILILDKKAGLVSTLKSPDFTALKDFQVDEKNKVIYVLNDGSLLKVTLP